MRNTIALLAVICALIGCVLFGFAWGHLAGDTKARETITADCVAHGHFEFRTHIYICDLNDESKQRVFSRPAEI